MVSSGFVQVMVSLCSSGFIVHLKFGTKFATKFDTKFGTKFDANFGRAYLLPICRFGTNFGMPSAKVWYQRKREVHNVNAQAYDNCGKI
jgi:hypothetical protein